MAEQKRLAKASVEYRDKSRCVRRRRRRLFISRKSLDWMLYVKQTEPAGQKDDRNDQRRARNSSASERVSTRENDRAILDI